MSSAAIIRIFLSSPSDVMEERKRVHEIAQEINQSIGFNLNRVIEIVGWENVVPSISIYAQDVINNTIKSYDVFLGILGARFGTPTPQAGSGTEEEFNIAYDKYKRSQIKDICMLFKVDGIPLNGIDTNQLQLVNNFKQKISDLGCYRTEFGPLTFDAEIRKLFSQIITKWEDTKDQYLSQQDDLEENTSINVDDDIGYYDAIFTAIEEMDVSNGVFDDLKHSTLKFHKAMEVVNYKLSNATSDSERMKVINLFGDDIQEFDNSLSFNSNKQKKHLEKSLQFFDKANELYLSDFKVPNEDLLKCRDGLLNYQEMLERGNITFHKTKEVIQKFPRATTKLNRSKKSLMQTFERHMGNNSESIMIIEKTILKMNKINFD